MNLGKRLIRFFLSDVSWVIAGQLAALCVGLISLKIYTHIFNSEQYAYFALFMATSGWIWLGLYQPLNQAVFRFGSTEQLSNQQQAFFSIWQRVTQRLTVVCLLISSLFCTVSAAIGQWRYFFLILAATGLGMVSGQLHAYVSYYLSQRMRRPVAWIQSLDGTCRLAGGLAGFALFTNEALATMMGVTLGAFLLLIAVKKLAKLPFKRKPDFVADSPTGLPIDFKHYTYKMFVLMLLNACALHLDKWLLLPLIGTQNLGIYAIVQTLAITATTVMYGVFEMLFFPLIFGAQAALIRRRYMRAMTTTFGIALVLVVTGCGLWGHMPLLWLTNPEAASHADLLTLLVAGSGIFQMARLLMAEAQLANMPHRYWPAYLIFTVTFSLWSLWVLQEGRLLQAGQGFLLSALLFLLSTAIISQKFHPRRLGQDKS